MSFPELAVGGRRGFFLAALVASAGVAVARIAGASAAGTRMRVHAVMRDLPPLAHTGGFGEPTCVQCHMDGELNEPGGTVTITGLPPRYQPGQRYTLRISVSHPELRAAGFELSARYESGPDSTRQAGTLAVDGDGAQVSIDGVTRARSCLRAGHERPERGEVGAEIVRWSIVEYYRPTA